VLIVPGAFTRPSSFERLAERLDADVVDLRRRRIAQLDVGGLQSMERRLDAAVYDIREDATPIVLVGHSMGGLLAYRAGLNHHIDGQVLLMPAPPEGLAPDIARLGVRDPRSALKLLALSFSTLPARMGPMKPPAGLFTVGASPEVVRESGKHRADESITALIQLMIGSTTPVRKTNTPTLVVGATQDGLVPAARVRRMAERLGADYHEFDVAHNFSEEPAGAVVDDAVEKWLRKRSLIGEGAS
jgi:pimeloyl-ACP methyl ester carboxylesterase